MKNNVVSSSGYRRCGSNFQNILSKLSIQHSSLATRYEIALRWMPLNLAKAKSMLTQICVAIMASQTHNESIHYWPLLLRQNHKWNMYPHTLRPVWLYPFLLSVFWRTSEHGIANCGLEDAKWNKIVNSLIYLLLRITFWYRGGVVMRLNT